MPDDVRTVGRGGPVGEIRTVGRGPINPGGITQPDSGGGFMEGLKKALPLLAVALAGMKNPAAGAGLARGIIGQRDRAFDERSVLEDERQRREALELQRGRLELSRQEATDLANLRREQSESNRLTALSNLVNTTLASVKEMPNREDRVEAIRAAGELATSRGLARPGVLERLVSNEMQAPFDFSEAENLAKNILAGMKPEDLERAIQDDTATVPFGASTIPLQALLMRTGLAIRNNDGSVSLLSPAESKAGSSVFESQMAIRKARFRQMHGRDPDAIEEDEIMVSVSNLTDQGEFDLLRQSLLAEQARAANARMAAGSQTPQEAQLSLSLSNQFMQATEEPAGRLRNFKTIDTLVAGEHTNPSDIALMFQFFKLLDPQSTVREGEAAQLEDAPGIERKWHTLWNRVIDGRRLLERDYQEILAASRDAVIDVQTELNGFMDIFSSRAVQNNIQPAAVVFDWNTVIGLGELDPSRALSLLPGASTDPVTEDFFNAPTGTR